MKNFLLNLLDWIYKKKCYFCGKSKDSAKMCSKCYEKMILNSTNVDRIIDGVNVYAAGIYETVIQKMIRGLKYHNQKELAYYQAKFMWEYWQLLNISGDFVIVPVPLHKTRQKKRKYNHMELVAIEFANFSGYETNFELITRIKDTRPQYNLKKAQRMENLKNAFEINSSILPQNRNILLIDDICTTGSTFESIIKELHNSKFYNITCLATACVRF